MSCLYNGLAQQPSAVTGVTAEGEPTVLNGYIRRKIFLSLPETRTK